MIHKKTKFSVIIQPVNDVHESFENRCTPNISIEGYVKNVIENLPKKRTTKNKCTNEMLLFCYERKQYLINTIYSYIYGNDRMMLYSQTSRKTDNSKRSMLFHFVWNRNGHEFNCVPYLHGHDRDKANNHE